jgi:hypothetical protein
MVFFCFLPGMFLISLVHRALPQSAVTDDVGAGCGKRFASQWWNLKGIVFDRKFAHCGLREYAEEEKASS